MSLFEAKSPRYSKHHLSRTNTIQTPPRSNAEDPYLAPDHVVGGQAQPMQTNVQVQPRRVSVAPIRSLSIRQQQQYPSSTSLCNTENRPVPPDREPRRVVSATLTRTIQRLEGLLGELDGVAVEAEDIALPLHDPPTFRRASTRLSPGIRQRAASLPLDPPIEVPARPKAALASPDRHVRFSDQGSALPNTAQHEHPSDGIRACDPIHHRPTPYKAALVPAAVTAPDQDFEMRLMWHRSQSESRFHEHFSLNPPPADLKRAEEGYHELTSKTPSETRISMSRRNYRRRVKAHQPPSILPRTTSVRGSSHEDDIDTTFPTGLPPVLKDLEADPRSLGHERHYTQMFGIDSRQQSIDHTHTTLEPVAKIDLRKHRHVDVPGDTKEFDVHQSCHHAPVARHWPVSRKRFAAVIACLNAACIGLFIGIYSGEVPAIQYVIVDFHHYTILGNVFLYCGMAMPTLFLWPLPLLHGRKVYTVAGLALALCLQIPQAVAVSNYRSPQVASYREALLLSRALSGFALGFVVINIQATLLDCFGASLQSHSPHGEVIDPYDVRRHGGGMGVWLGLWSFASLASISLGFMIGAFIINNNASVTWGFWTCFLLLGAVLLLNIINPEVRRSAYRRTLTELRGQEGGFSRVARGEVKMHLESTGPYWWGEEVLAGIKMSWLMARQPGFLVLAVYTAWVYAQFTLILMVSHLHILPAWTALIKLLALGCPGIALLHVHPYPRRSLCTGTHTRSTLRGTF